MPSHAAGSSAAAPSGEQFTIRHDESVAEITEVGATLRGYRVGGEDVVDGFAVGERASDGRGQVLAPWPNRIAGGRYSYGGYDVQCPLTEPGGGNAIHGLVRWLPWQPMEHRAASVGLSCKLWPQPGYEWRLDLTVAYRLDESGLTVELSARNSGTQRAPFGAGCHPYLRVGPARIDDLELTVPARERVTFGDATGDGGAREPVAGTAYDFTLTRPIGSTALDTAYASLVRGEDRRAVAQLRDRDSGRSVRLWVDEAFGYLMVYTGDHVQDPARRRTSVAIEPMTCPPQAMRTGTDLLGLAPGDTWSGRWGLVAEL